MSAGGMEPGRHVVFLLGDQRFAVPIRLVQEVLAPPPITPIPGAPVWLLGVFNRRGDIMSAVDIANRLRVVRRREAASARLLIVATRLFSLGVLVDSVEEILSIAEEETIAAENHHDGESYVSRALLKSGKLISIVDLEPILNSEELLSYR